MGGSGFACEGSGFTFEDGGEGRCIKFATADIKEGPCNISDHFIEKPVASEFQGEACFGLDECKLVKGFLWISRGGELICE